MFEAGLYDHFFQRYSGSSRTDTNGRNGPIISFRAIQYTFCEKKPCTLQQTHRVALKNPWATLRWRHNERDGVSNHQPHDCLRSRLFRRRSKETPKLRVPGLCAGNSPATDEFPAQRTSNASSWHITSGNGGGMGGAYNRKPQDYVCLKGARRNNTIWAVKIR